ncbi:uncharacterized protein CC84DRAFT_969846 [Paraphaeosphaeria sporulosa]|uniref:Uncharacterized protein n=1 Tax=Paraphaeosphaeria sporulosa TaxID=1460663 RepID=A0A177C975_9PLEO|nr:uncharacterized protein CC84DRAFT_969846 [Paraphaeosphaeria sporulosa]OAG03328.1 hypothetical protein CC84DRAFT_969846 [Paraphaeosphaeria sporulosa]
MVMSGRAQGPQHGRLDACTKPQMSSFLLTRLTTTTIRAIFLKLIPEGLSSHSFYPSFHQTLSVLVFHCVRLVGLLSEGPRSRPSHTRHPQASSAMQRWGQCVVWLGHCRWPAHMEEVLCRLGQLAHITSFSQRHYCIRQWAGLDRTLASCLVANLVNCAVIVSPHVSCMAIEAV